MGNFTSPVATPTPFGGGGGQTVDNSMVHSGEVDWQPDSSNMTHAQSFSPYPPQAPYNDNENALAPRLMHSSADDAFSPAVMGTPQEPPQPVIDTPAGGNVPGAPEAALEEYLRFSTYHRPDSPLHGPSINSESSSTSDESV